MAIETWILASYIMEKEVKIDKWRIGIGDRGKCDKKNVGEK